jgi:hypothetical protein
MHLSRVSRVSIFTSQAYLGLGQSGYAQGDTLECVLPSVPWLGLSVLAILVILFELGRYPTEAVGVVVIARCFTGKQLQTAHLFPVNGSLYCMQFKHPKHSRLNTPWLSKDELGVEGDVEVQSIADAGLLDSE